MVEIHFYQINKNEAPAAAVADDMMVFSTPKPAVIQPAEILQIQTGIVMKVPPGYVVTLSTHPDLSEKAAELFPGVTTVDSYAPEAELKLAVRNSGRNQLNLMPGALVAVGYVSKIHEIEVGEFEPGIIANPQMGKSKPQKKNPFRFEVK